MVKVYGVSDDIVEIDNSEYKENEIGCFKRDVRICFCDGTVIRVGYPKRQGAIWWIQIEKQGTADHTFTECADEDADVYSDVFEIDSDVKSHSVIKQKYREVSDDA